MSAPEINEIAQAAIEKYPEARRFLDEPTPSSGEDVANERYVYEWFTKDDGKVFLVGRGVRTRYKHVLWSIKRGTGRGLIYKRLQEEHGIDYRIVHKGLNFHESKVLAYALIRQRLDEGARLHQDLSQWID